MMETIKVSGVGCTLVLTIVILATLTDGRSIYVSHDGKDTKSCGKNRNKPCRSLSQAVLLSTENDIIEMDHTGGTYTVAPSSGDFVNITHSLLIRPVSKNQHVKLNCSRGRNGMFDVFTPQKEAGSTSTTLTFTMERMNIQGCIGTLDNPSIIRLADATINIYNSQSGGVGVLLHHPQIGGSPCSMAKVSIVNSTLTACGLVKPYLPCIVMMGCNTTEVHVQDTLFDYSGVLLQGDENLIVNMVNSTFNGQNLRGPSLDMILAQNQSQISLTDCVITSHDHSKDSAVRVAIEQPSQFPSLHFTNVTFASNIHTNQAGGAISLLARYSTDPLRMNAEFSRCIFTDNSAQDVGGAIYIEGLDTIKLNHCLFEGNSAVDGGAVFIFDSQHITLFNSTFKKNQALGRRHLKYKGVGGAVRAVQSDIKASWCNFTNNTADLHGQAIHATDMILAYIENCVFSNSTSLGWSSPITQLYLKQVITANGQHSKLAVRLKGNIYDSINTSSHFGMFHTEVKGQMVSDNITVCCPVGQHVEYMSQPQYTEVGQDPGSSLDEAWCTACPMDTYNLRRDCLVLDDTGKYDKHQAPACIACPDYAKCTETGRITALRNYWGRIQYRDSNKIVFQQCPHNYCNPTSCNSIECCSNGRAGPLCGKCQDGYHLNLATDVCVPEADCRYMVVFSILYSVAFGAVYFTLILFFVVLTWFCLIPGSIQQSPGTIDISGHTPGDENSLQSSLRDGDPYNDDLHGREAINHSRDDGSDSFEPSLPSDYTRSIDSHGLVPVQDDATQTSDRLNRVILIKTQSNLMTGHPFVLCVCWMSIQLIEEVYQPWYGTQDRRYAIINGIFDIVNFRPVYYMLGVPCISGEVASVSKIPLVLLCVASMFSILIATLILGHIILIVISKIKRSEVTHQKVKLNTTMSMMFVTILTLVYLPILKCCFQLIHCVRQDSESQLKLFINGAMTCNYWWHWLVIVVIAVNLAPLGLAIWTGLPLLKARHIHCIQFTVGLLFPLPAAMYWVCRYGKSVCHCLFPYEFHFQVMQSGLYEMNVQHFQSSEALRSFFCNPFQILSQMSKQSELPQAEGRIAWVILIFIRGFVFITFSTMLSHSPIMKAIILITLLLLAITLHIQWKPYGRRSANRMEGYLLSFLTILAILGMNNALIYSTGIEPFGYLGEMLHVNDWIFIVIVTAVLVFYFVTVIYYIIKASISKSQV